MNYRWIRDGDTFHALTERKEVAKSFHAYEFDCSLEHEYRQELSPIDHRETWQMLRSRPTRFVRQKGQIVARKDGYDYTFDVYELN